VYPASAWKSAASRRGLRARPAPIRLRPEAEFLIRSESVRKAGFAALCTFAVSASPAAVAEQDAGAPLATMICEHAAAPGRVRCEVEARVGPGESITWGDVVLVQMPPFAAALRGRIGPHDAAVHEPALWRWAFAIVARDKGSGDLEGRVRVVVCKEKVCVAEEVRVAGRVEVGP
jgi:hypothetical protein